MAAYCVKCNKSSVAVRNPRTSSNSHCSTCTSSQSPLIKKFPVHMEYMYMSSTLFFTSSSTPHLQVSSKLYSPAHLRIHAPFISHRLRMSKPNKLYKKRKIVHHVQYHMIRRKRERKRDIILLFQTNVCMYIYSPRDSIKPSTPIIHKRMRLKKTYSQEKGEN